MWALPVQLLSLSFFFIFSLILFFLYLFKCIPLVFIANLTYIIKRPWYNVAGKEKHNKLWWALLIQVKSWNSGFWSEKILNSWLQKFKSELRSSKSPHDQFFIALGKGVVLMRSWSGEFLSVDVNVVFHALFTLL